MAHNPLLNPISNAYIFGGSLQDRLEMALFVGRYVSCMIMFVLGMKAPGIMHQFEFLEGEDETRRNIPPRVSY